MEGIKVHNVVETKEEARTQEVLIREFLGLNETEFASIKDRISTVAGHVRVAVHPLFLEKTKGLWGLHPTDKSPAEVHEFLEDGFKRTIRNVANDTRSSPLITFEEESNVERTTQLIRETGHISSEESLGMSGFLMVSTEQSSSSIWADQASLAYEKVHDVQPGRTVRALRARQQEVAGLVWARTITGTILQAWSEHYTPKEIGHLRFDADRIDIKYAEDSIIRRILQERVFEVEKNLFAELGIKSALVSGIFFDDTFYRKSANERQKLSGCAGATVERLKDFGIKVDISRYSWAPKGHLKSIGYETKQTGMSQ